MNGNTTEYRENGEAPEIRENVVAGIVGAFLFSLAGAAAYFLLHLIGYIASISGLIAAVCAVKGYAVFARKESKKGIVIAAVMALLIIVLAWYFCLAYDVYDAYKMWYETGEMDFSVTFIEAFRVAPSFLEIPEIAGEYSKDLCLSILFCLIGGGSFIVNKMRNAGKTKTEQPKAQAAPSADPPTESTPEETHIEH